ncbi:rmuC family protein, partial [Vibrio parahaemolyticus V-223/04]
SPSAPPNCTTSCVYSSMIWKGWAAH